MHNLTVAGTESSPGVPVTF